MVGVIAKLENHQGKLADMLGMSLGQGIGNGLNTFFANRSLESVMHDKALEGAPQSKKLEALQSALSPYGEKGQEIFQQRMLIDKQEREEQELARNQKELTRKQKREDQELANTEEEKEVLGRVLSGETVSNKDMAKVSPQNQLKLKEIQQKKQLGKNVRQNLIDAGYPTPTAELWQNQVENSTTGGLTDTIKEVNQLLKRSSKGKGNFGEEEKSTLAPPLKIPGIEDQNYDLDFPELKTPIGRSGAELVKEASENRKINAPLYSDTIDSLSALDEDYRDFNQLQEYNRAPGALPTGLNKWNVDWETGDLRFPALATPETQDYVKIIARLLGRAKEYFPGRVTNFDLAQFSKRFPRLANSPEGRELITKQLMLGNRIAYLKDETMKAAIDHYGADSDPTQIRKHAYENYKKLKPQLENELKSLNRKSDEIYNNSIKENPQISSDEVEVTYKGKKGKMSREKYEQAKSSKYGDQYELVQ